MHAVGASVRDNGHPNVFWAPCQRQSERSPVRAFFFMPPERLPSYGHYSDTCHHEDRIMADPTKVPNSPSPNNMRTARVVEPSSGLTARNRRSYPWAWIVAVIIILLIIWAFFGWNNRGRMVSPVNAPAAATSTVR